MNQKEVEARLRDIMEHPSYRLAYLDFDYLQREDLRPLRLELELLKPEFICCLGSVAARTILRTKQSVGKLRGQFFKYRGSRVLVTYHPAYLLRNPSAKRLVWDDMKRLLNEMGISL